MKLTFQLKSQIREMARNYSPSQIHRLLAREGINPTIAQIQYWSTPEASRLRQKIAARKHYYNVIKKDPNKMAKRALRQANIREAMK